MDKAIIGGTGVYDIGEDSCTRKVETAYGSVEVDIADIAGEEVVFLARHGKGHSTPPHRINFRANMAALKQLGVKFIYATAAVGSCNDNYAPGDIVVFKDFLDMTKVRPLTFYEGEDGKVRHTDMSDPYCRSLRKRFLEAARELQIHVKGGDSVYVCTEGPRFETASEIKVYKMLGGDIVGMTNVPEVILAKELGMCYAAVGIVTNWCTGMKNESIALHDIQGSLAENKEKITKAFLRVFQGPLNQENCTCTEAIIEL
ncbi:MAG TPA: S-methyl-5'-thioinosine phosphorylase [Clostridia bacterium]|nr:S-methyl-5'-thioinosine phosphorylase [Clostridia bacterium]